MHSAAAHLDLQPVDLLWTGGWDSTFRLLDVVLRHHHPVQPWYVIDRERASTERELATMQTIRRALAERDAHAAALVRNSRFVERSSIHPDAALEALYAESRLGSQYQTKGDLYRQAEEIGFLDLMRRTWTCHAPKRGAPCGGCAPCLTMMRSGQGWRIPATRRVRPLLRMAKANFHQGHAPADV